MTATEQARFAEIIRELERLSADLHDLNVDTVPLDGAIEELTGQLSEIVEG